MNHSYRDMSSIKNSSSEMARESREAARDCRRNEIYREEISEQSGILPLYANCVFT